jgi:hypothetical protein
MKLRTHPFMSYRGVSNWPPVWVGTNRRHEPLKGEVGVLKDVVPSQSEGANNSRKVLPANVLSLSLLFAEQTRQLAEQKPRAAFIRVV